MNFGNAPPSLSSYSSSSLSSRTAPSIGSLLDRSTARTFPAPTSRLSASSDVRRALLLELEAGREDHVVLHAAPGADVGVAEEIGREARPHAGDPQPLALAAQVVGLAEGQVVRLARVVDGHLLVALSAATGRSRRSACRACRRWRGWSRGCRRTGGRGSCWIVK